MWELYTRGQRKVTELKRRGLDRGCRRGLGSECRGLAGGHLGGLVLVHAAESVDHDEQEQRGVAELEDLERLLQSAVPLQAQ